MPKYLVETMSTFRIKYVIECKNMDHAKDEVMMNNAEEFSQEHLGEEIISCREIPDEEIPVMFFNDNPYLVDNFGDEYAFKYVHRVDYDGQE
jgi:hypothetical protein